MRFSQDNATTGRLLKAIERRLENQNIVVVQGYNRSFNTVQELLDMSGIGENHKYVVFVTAKGRMSDSFPADCGYGLDFTPRSDTWASLIQGILGRMFGYNKDPLVILSDANYNRVIKCQEEEDGLPSGKLLGGARTKEGDEYTHFYVEDYKNDKKMMAVFDRVQKKIIEPCIFPSGVQLGDNVKFDLVRDCLGGDVGFDLFQSRTTNSLMRLGEADGYSRSYTTGKFGGPGVSFRSVKSGQPGYADKGEDGLSRNIIVRGRRDEAGWVLVGVDLLNRYDDGGRTIKIVESNVMTKIMEAA